MEVLRWLPLDLPMERIDDFWRQLILYGAFAESHLAESRDRKTEAEAARADDEQQAARATQMVWERMKIEAAAEMDATRDMQARDDGVSREAEAELARDRIIAEAQRKGQGMLEQARMAAQRECTELRREALMEIKAVLARVETIRAAADEELETQRVLTEVARLQASSAALLAEVTSIDGSEVRQEQLGSLEAPGPQDKVPAGGAAHDGAGASGPGGQASSGGSEGRGKPRKGRETESLP